jgi:hypothetical protein
MGFRSSGFVSISVCAFFATGAAAPGEALVFELLADRERPVAASALDVIEFYRPDDAALHRLAATVIGGVVNPELEGPLVSVLAKRGRDDDLCHLAMSVLRDRSTNPRTRLRIRRILGLDA